MFVTIIRNLRNMSIIRKLKEYEQELLCMMMKKEKKVCLSFRKSYINMNIQGNMNIQLYMKYLTNMH